MEIAIEQLETPVRYKLMIGTIVPRPIAFVSTISHEGMTNLAPFSYFTGVGSDPMTLLFCPAARPDGSDKDTLRNARPVSEGGTGQFVVNLASETYARQVAAAAEPLDPDESEFNLTGLAQVPSRVVRPPRVADSPIAYECETMQVISLHPDAPGVPGSPYIVIGRVVHLFVRDDLLNERFHVDIEKLGAIGRLGGLAYCRLTDRFDMPFGREALKVDEKSGD